MSAFSSPALAAEPTKKERIRGWQEAIDRASEAGETARVNALRRELAHYAEGVGEYVQAARQYELLLALRPPRRERVRLFVQLGKVRDALQEYDKALNAFQDALHDDADDYEANLALARAYAKIDLNSKAIDRYRRCVKLNPKDAKARAELAAVYQRTGYLAKAIAAYKEAIALDPAPESFLGLADCYVHQDALPRATEVLQQAKATVPRAEYDVRLGELFEKAGHLAKAAAAWEEALKADVKRDDVRLKLALLYARLHRVRESEKLLKGLLDAYPESPLVHFLQAMVLVKRGDRAGARREAAAVQRLAPTETVHHYNERLLQLLNK
jgi:tetratricopeptide (TPR) repeat protein